MVAIIGLRDEIVGNPQLLKSLKSLKIEQTTSVNEKYSPEDTDDILKRLLDFNGDGKLTSSNGKEYANNVLVAGFQRLTGGGKDTQVRIA